MRRFISVLLVVIIMTMGQSGDVFLPDSKVVKYADSELTLVFANGPTENQDVKGLYTPVSYTHLTLPTNREV